MRCPDCSGAVEESKGSAVSPYINTYRCAACGWMSLRCGKGQFEIGLHR